MTPNPQANTVDELRQKLHRIFDDVYIQSDITFIDIEVEKEITDKILPLIEEARLDEVVITDCCHCKYDKACPSKVDRLKQIKENK